ncbi:large neutral amino acids transporter small subunit 2-like [Neopsephotus bourkii]|uniref:large neutral amino acids transporter small subunit 2-like n=1 Tax=Neopsephotus bourkii TaxID=309878 RepID=UPI002AA519B2|nr:large neutral amino acids transporter small subunit 2-like [Neopsephotus bourkii]
MAAPAPRDPRSLPSSSSSSLLLEPHLRAKVPDTPPPVASMAEGTPAARAPPGGGGVSLRKELGLLSACSIIVGNIIGSGIFISPRGVLAHAGSVGLALALWGAAGALTALGALCYAELGLRIPRAGGDYAYVKDVFGGLVGFLRLWVSVLVILPTSQAVIALTFAASLLTPLAPWGCPMAEPALRLLAAAALLLLTWVGCRSSRWATRVQDVCTAGKLAALGIVIAAGIYRLCTGRPGWLHPSQALQPVLVPGADGAGAGTGVSDGVSTGDAGTAVPWQWWPGLGPVAVALLQGSFAYGGWNFLNYGTQELREPQRNLPRAIFISIPLVTFVYVAANAAYVTAMDPQEILQSEAVAVTFGERALGPLAWTMPVGVALSTFGGINGCLFTCSRLFYAGACEGQLPALLGMIHVERSTPVPALLLSCASTLLMLVGGDTEALLSYVGFTNLLW